MLGQEFGIGTLSGRADITALEVWQAQFGRPETYETRIDVAMVQ